MPRKKKSDEEKSECEDVGDAPPVSKKPRKGLKPKAKPIKEPPIRIMTKEEYANRMNALKKLLMEDKKNQNAYLKALDKLKNRTKLI